MSDPIEVLRRMRDGWAAGQINEDEKAAIDAALASLSAKPEGEWVMVPREPTRAMCNAAWKYGVGDEAPDPGYAYRAMLAAAPKLPPMNDNAVAVNESAPVNDKPESAEAAWRRGLGLAPSRPKAVAWAVTCPSGRTTAYMHPNPPKLTEPGWSARPLVYGDTAPPRPEASAPFGECGCGKPVDYFDVMGRPSCNKRIRCSEQQASAPVGVEGLPRFGFPKGDEPRPVPCADGYWTPWHLAQQPAAVDGAMVERAAEAAWLEFKSGLEERNWERAPAVRKDRLRIIVRTALTAALAGQQQGGASNE